MASRQHDTRGDEAAAARGVANRIDRIWPRNSESLVEKGAPVVVWHVVCCHGSSQATVRGKEEEEKKESQFEKVLYMSRDAKGGGIPNPWKVSKLHQDWKLGGACPRSSGSTAPMASTEVLVMMMMMMMKKKERKSFYLSALSEIRLQMMAPKGYSSVVVIVALNMASTATGSTNSNARSEQLCCFLQGEEGKRSKKMKEVS